MGKVNAIDAVSEIALEAVREVLESSTGTKIRYSPTIQKIPTVSLKPDIGCFVQFSGDYTGLFIMNFQEEAAYELYRGAMELAGMPEGEIARHAGSDDVVNFVGETVNQVIGAVRRRVESEFGLAAGNTQPKAIGIAAAITMQVATLIDTPVCRRLSFRTEGNRPFYVELNMERSEFIRLREEEAEELDIDALLSGS